MVDQYTIRQATVSDASLLAGQRTTLYADIIEPQHKETFRKSTEAAYKELLEKNTYFGWLLECNGSPVATVGLITRRLLPNTTNPNGCNEAVIVQVYTEPDYKQQGLDRRLMEAIIDWCRNRGIERVTLQANDDGHPLYTSLGFTPTKEMRLDVKQSEQTVQAK